MRVSNDRIFFFGWNNLFLFLFSKHVDNGALWATDISADIFNFLIRGIDRYIFVLANICFYFDSK